MLATEQTVVLVGRMTSFTAVCEACQAEQRADLLEESWLGARVSGTLRLEEDRGWATCERGHRVRLVREEHRAERPHRDQERLESVERGAEPM